jgi:Divergent InlB B-repeat domain
MTDMDPSGMLAPRLPLGSWRRRFAVCLFVALLAAGNAHFAARQAAAGFPDYCTSTYYCATLTISWSGDGDAHMVDDQGGIDCYYNGSNPASGTCTYLYYWIGESSPTLTVTLAVTANANSYVCTSGCSAAGGTKSAPFPLSRNTDNSVLVEADLATSLVVTIHPGGDGNGRVTSSPTGIDCVLAAGIASGACSHTWYSSGTGVSYSLLLAPAAGNYACYLGPNSKNCDGVDKQILLGTFTTSGVDGQYVWFYKSHPVLTVGVSGAGTVVSSPSGITCPSTCSSYFAPSSDVALNAAAKSGYAFSHWTGSCAGSGASCNLSLGTTDVSTTAVFAALVTAPPATARPSSPARTPAPSSPPVRGTPTPAASPGRSASPAATLGPGVSGEPDGGPAPLESAATPEPSDAVAIAVGSAGPTPPTDHATGASGAGPGSTVDIGIVAFAGLLGALVLILGLAIGIRAGRRREPDAR